MFSAKDFQPLPTTIGEDDGVAFPTEERVEESSDAWLIVDHQNLCHVLLLALVYFSWTGRVARYEDIYFFHDQPSGPLAGSKKTNSTGMRLSFLSSVTVPNLSNKCTGSRWNRNNISHYERLSVSKINNLPQPSIGLPPHRSTLREIDVPPPAGHLRAA